MSGEVKLLPCPFCGGEARRYTATTASGFENRQVQCDRCGASAFDLKWNMRPNQAISLPDRSDIARVLFDQRGTQHDFDDASEADAESDAGTLYSIVHDDADSVLALAAATRLAVPASVGREEVARMLDQHLPMNDLFQGEHREAVIADLGAALISHAEAGGVEVPSGWKLVPVERLNQFQTAVADIPEVAKRLQAGQQFNVYDSGANEDDCDDEDCEMVIAIGPINRALWLGDTGGRANGQMIEAALKFAAEALAASPAAVAGGEA